MGTKGKDPLDYSDPEWHKRQARWRHTSFLGHCERARISMVSMQQASTTTSQTTLIARSIEVLLVQLRDSLKERHDG